MPLGTRVWKLGKLLLLAGALGLTFLVFFGIAMRAALKAREVRVPGLVGSTIQEAARALATLGMLPPVLRGRRHPWTLFGGLAVGLAQSVLSPYASITAYRSAAPFVLAIVALLYLSRRRVVTISRAAG